MHPVTPTFLGPPAADPRVALPPVILIVDDNAANRDTLIELLAVRNYRFSEAADGPGALRLAAENPPDLVLLDVMMPGMDGYEVCRRLRAHPRLSEVPVIMITALDDESSRLAGIEAGADDFITKPFNRAELRARVQTITRLNRYRRLADAHAALRESEVRFRNLADQCDEAFRFVTLHPERVVYVSPALEKIWGLPAVRFLEDARLWAKAVHPDDRGRVHAAYETLLARKTDRFAEEYRVVRPDGTVRWVLDSGTTIRDSSDRVVSVGSVARDITERKAAEGVMLRAQRMENIGMLAAGIAHDFNNALAPLVMGCTILRAHVEDPAGRRILEMMDKGVGRSVALVRQLLSFARGASGQRQILQTRYVLRELAELAEVTFPKSIRVRATLPGELWPVFANATQIHQVFLNLCVNARDAMPQGGELTITAENRAVDAAAAAVIEGGRTGDFLVVEIRDTGTGIAPDVLPRIWEPFFTTKDEDKGTGLGLSTVSGILHQHDGFVTVETGPSGGTAFTVYLPATEGAGEKEKPGTVSSTRGGNELVLIVDDEEPVRVLAAEILQAHGYRSVTACNGAEAIAVFAPRVAEVRLVLADLQMPLLGGAALASVLHGLNPRLPIIAISGSEEQNAAGCEAFAAGFLAKPFFPDALLAIVRRTLDAVQAAPGRGASGVGVSPRPDDLGPLVGSNKSGTTAGQNAAPAATGPAPPPPRQ